MLCNFNNIDHQKKSISALHCRKRIHYIYSKQQLYLFCAVLHTESKCAILRRILRIVALYGCPLLSEFYHHCGATKRKISWNAFPRDSCRFERLHWKAENPLSVFEVAVLSSSRTIFIVSHFEFPRNRLNTTSSKEVNIFGIMLEALENIVPRGVTLRSRCIFRF